MIIIHTIHSPIQATKLLTNTAKPYIIQQAFISSLLLFTIENPHTTHPRSQHLSWSWRMPSKPPLVLFRYACGCVQNVTPHGVDPSTVTLNNTALAIWAKDNSPCRICRNLVHRDQHPKVRWLSKQKVRIEKIITKGTGKNKGKERADNTVTLDEEISRAQETRGRMEILRAPEKLQMPELQQISKIPAPKIWHALTSFPTLHEEIDQSLFRDFDGDFTTPSPIDPSPDTAEAGGKQKRPWWKMWGVKEKG